MPNVRVVATGIQAEKLAGYRGSWLETDGELAQNQEAKLAENQQAKLADGQTGGWLTVPPARQ